MGGEWANDCAAFPIVKSHRRHRRIRAARFGTTARISHFLSILPTSARCSQARLLTPIPGRERVGIEGLTGVRGDLYGTSSTRVPPRDKLGAMSEKTTGTNRVRVLDLGGEIRWDVSSGPRLRRAYVCRDRHGRGNRGVLVPAMLPRYRTRRETFDELVIQEVRSLVAACPELAAIQYGVEDVPPSDPAPWESESVVLGRGFGADPGKSLPAQVVVYRRPLEQRARSTDDLRSLIHGVVLEESSQLIGKHPEDIDPYW